MRSRPSGSELIMRYWPLVKTFHKVCGEPLTVTRMRHSALPLALVAPFAFVLVASAAIAQSGPLVLDRSQGVISLEAYAPNIVRITMSTDPAAAAAAPGYGFVAHPSADGWTHERESDGTDVYRSAQMVVHIAPANLPKDKLPQAMPLDELNNQLREHFFPGSGGTGGPHN